MNTNEHVILLHGLCRTRKSMLTMEKSLNEAGFKGNYLPLINNGISIEQFLGHGFNAD